MSIPNSDGDSTNTDGSSTNSEQAKPEDAIETLPFDEPSSETKEKEKELPMLGGEG